MVAYRRPFELHLFQFIQRRARVKALLVDNLGEKCLLLDRHKFAPALRSFRSHRFVRRGLLMARRWPKLTDDPTEMEWPVYRAHLLDKLRDTVVKLGLVFILRFRATKGVTFCHVPSVARKNTPQ